jgi:opacity protein-like surface antigen
MIFLTFGANAQERHNLYLGMNFMYTLQNLDEGNTADKFNSPVPLNIDFDDSFGLQLRAGLNVNEYFTGELMYEYVFPFKTDVGKGYTSEIDVMNFLVNAKLTFPFKENLIPYGIVGLGFMNTYEEIRGRGFKEKSDWGPATRIGLGGDVYLTSDISVNGEIAYVIGLGNVDHAKYTNFSVGAAYHF